MSFICHLCSKEIFNIKDVTPESEERDLCAVCLTEQIAELYRNLRVFGLDPEKWTIEPHSNERSEWVIIHRDNIKLKLKGLSSYNTDGVLYFESINIDQELWERLPSAYESHPKTETGADH